MNYITVDMTVTMPDGTVEQRTIAYTLPYGSSRTAWADNVLGMLTAHHWSMMRLQMEHGKEYRL